MKKTKICDPLYNYIYLDQGERALVNHPVFQRLRSISQLGFCEWAFPSGTHKRFAHSLGTCHLAGEAFDSIFSKNKSLLPESKKQFFRKSLRIAALLHDVGHAPLSHCGESLLPPLKSLNMEKFLNTDFNRPARHEDYGLKFIIEKEGLRTAIQQAGGEPLAVAQLLHPEFLDKNDFFIEKGLNFLPLLRQIISSEFDVDRMDYLYRDSLFCGVNYGLIDFIWLISHFDCHIEKNQVFLAVAKEALYSLESLALGRQHMRLAVYFHYKSAIYNHILKNYSKDCGWRLPVDISSYILWDDGRLFGKLKSDKNIWAKRIIHQKPYLRLYEDVFLERSLGRKGSTSLYGGVFSKRSLGQSALTDFELSSLKKMEFLKRNLKKEGIGFIEIDSEKHSIKPNKKAVKGYNVYLKDNSLNQAGLLFESQGLLRFPSRKMQRLYVEPELFSKAKPLLSEIY